MATVLTSHETAPAGTHAMRVLPIVADLMPPEIVDARRARQAQRTVLAALAAFAVLLCGWYGVATYQASVARDDLASATNTAVQIQREQQRYSEVTRLQTQSKAITTDLSSLFVSDVRWAKLLTALRTAAPPRLSVVSASAALAQSGDGAPAPAAGPAAAGTPAEGAPAAAASAQRVVGTVEISGTGPDKASIATYLDAVGVVPGLANPLLASATDEEGGVHFSMKVDVTAAALGGRYAAKKGPGE